MHAINTTHGMRFTSEYRAYRNMLARCYNRNCVAYKNYGGRGIIVEPIWKGEGGFERWFAHIGPKPSNEHSLERIKNDEGYVYGNIRWATPKEQNRNTRVVKLSEEKVKEIRFLYTKGATQRQLAEMYGVSQRNICRIVNNKLWK